LTVFMMLTESVYILLAFASYDNAAGRELINFSNRTYIRS